MHVHLFNDMFVVTRDIRFNTITSKFTKKTLQFKFLLPLIDIDGIEEDTYISGKQEISI